VQEDDFLTAKGLGNEVPFRIFDYLLELEAKLDARIEMLGGESAAEKGRLGKQVKELEKYDGVLHNKSLEYIDIDLDDGVKVNYAKFEGLVGKI